MHPCGCILARITLDRVMLICKKVKQAILFLAAVLPAAAANDWFRISSPNFEMYSNAGAKDALETIEYFEQVRDFFMRTRASNAATRLPITIVGFRGPKDYKPYA